MADVFDTLNTTEQLVFEEMCKLEQNWYGVTVFSCISIAVTLALSVYKTRKAMHGLKDKGLVVRASVGCPAIGGGGECGDFFREAAPPINGFELTDEARKSRVWEQAKENHHKALAGWASASETDD